MKTRTQKHLAVQYMARGHRALMGQCLLLISLLASAAVSASNLTDVEFNFTTETQFMGNLLLMMNVPTLLKYLKSGN